MLGSIERSHAGIRLEEMALDDFVEQRKAGCSRPLMGEIESQFQTGAASTASLLDGSTPLNRARSNITSDEPDLHTLSQADGIDSGDILYPKGTH
jgi:hypothetical protein